MSHNLSTPIRQTSLVLGKSPSLIQAKRIKPLNRSSKNQKPANQLANRHSRLLSLLPAGVVVIDGQGEVVEVNEAARNLLDEPLVGERWISVIQRAFQPKPDDGHDVSLKNGRLVNISTNPLEGEPGQLVLLNDVTETRALQKKVSHMQRLSTMGEVAARLAHQIRTPLSSALLYLSPLLKSDTDERVKQRFAKKLHNNLTHMEQLIKNLLAFSRGDIAETAPERVDQVLLTIQQQFAEQADAKNFPLTIEHQAEDCLIYASKDALCSAIHNLLNNAKQACGEQGQLRLSSRLVEDEGNRWVDIIVEDNGCGISQAEQEKIMAPFYTTHSSGTGLGLAVVQSISKAHKGMLWLNSEEGQGSQFGIRLPLYQHITQTREQKDAQVAVD